MKYAQLFSAVLFAGLLKVNAQDCDVVKNILRNYYQIDETTDCCSYAYNDQFVVGCNGGTVNSLAIINNPSIIEVPVDVASLAGLETLDFSNCNVQQFPYTLKALPNLKSINLWKNAIGELTDEISQFPALEKLDLSENGLTALPNSIGQMANLNELNVSRNYLVNLPDSLSSLSNLKKLNVEGNQNLGGSLKKFGKTVDTCNIRNTHVCIEEKGVCDNYVINNTRMPYCHPENFSEKELEVGSDESEGGGKSHTALIIIGIIVGVLLLAAIAGFIIAKSRKKNNNTTYGSVQNNNLEGNYRPTSPNNYQNNYQNNRPNSPHSPHYQGNQMNQMNHHDISNGSIPSNVTGNSYSVDINPLFKH